MCQKFSHMTSFFLCLCISLVNQEVQLNVLKFGGFSAIFPLKVKIQMYCNDNVNVTTSEE